MTHIATEQTNLQIVNSFNLHNVTLVLSLTVAANVMTYLKSCVRAANFGCSVKCKWSRWNSQTDCYPLYLSTSPLETSCTVTFYSCLNKGFQRKTYKSQWKRWVNRNFHLFRETFTNYSPCLTFLVADLRTPKHSPKDEITIFHHCLDFDTITRSIHCWNCCVERGFSFVSF